MLVIGIAGGSGSGKSKIVSTLLDLLPKDKIVVLPQDAYYQCNAHLPLADRKSINYDHPDSIDFDLLINHLSELKAGRSIEQPTYSFIECIRLQETIHVDPAPIILIEGILIFTHAELRDKMDLKVFIDVDDDDRLGRIIKRDIIKRGKTIEDVLERYGKTVKPMYLEFIGPSKRFANFIIPQGAKNIIAVEILAQYINSQLKKQDINT